MRRTAVLNVVGLTESLLGPHTPHLERFRARGSLTRIVPAFPAVTCTAQANYLTGQPPRVHGIVGNGWYHRELAEVHFWKQSNHLVTAPKLWETLRASHAGNCPAPRSEPCGAGFRPAPTGLLTPIGTPTAALSSPIVSPPDPAGPAPFTCATLFWWFNMYSSADYSITPRPLYPADGRKVFDIHTWPYSIRSEIKRDLGEFPFPCFWGPAAGRATPAGSPDAASRWIADSAKWIEQRYAPTLSLIYLPHLDYCLQRHGPPAGRTRDQGPGTKDQGLRTKDHNTRTPTDSEAAPGVWAHVEAIDAIVGELIAFFHARGVQVIVLSEYGLTPVDTPIHLNRLFRQHGWLAVKDELGRETLDAGASRVFAVADHQVAHLYLNDRSLEAKVRRAIEAVPGVAQVLDAEAKRACGLDHPRAGDLVAIARENAWFTYYYWFDDAVAPDFARCVDIHRKPGYDPVELFTNPAWSAFGLRARLAWRLLRKRLGFRMLMDVIPLDASLVRGSHGGRPSQESDWPVLLLETPDVLPARAVPSTDVHRLLAQAMGSNIDI
ncbi:MAG: alkaline phosphatase family protein [Verrucomicrobia bacterium]|nr:alkaline phosphatase family protein [Verrucomicrobiota bacterium]